MEILMFFRCAAVGVVSTFVFLAFFTGKACALDKGERREHKAIDTIIIHAIGGPNEACPNGRLEFTEAGGNAKFWKNYFDTHEKVSIHYIIDRQGDLQSSIRDQEIAFHAGSRELNAKSIGIELVNRGDGVEEYQKQLTDKLIILIKELRQKYTIPIENIKGHEEVDKSTFKCGGQTHKRKVDPGKMFHMQEIKKAIQ